MSQTVLPAAITQNRAYWFVKRKITVQMKYNERKKSMTTFSPWLNAHDLIQHTHTHTHLRSHLRKNLDLRETFDMNLLAIYL